MSEWKSPDNASSLIYQAKFMVDPSMRDLLKGAEEGAAEGEEAGPEGAAVGALAGAAAAMLTGNMDLWFQNGRVYTFFDVPYTVYQQLLAADSPGSYYNANIRGKYTG